MSALTRPFFLLVPATGSCRNIHRIAMTQSIHAAQNRPIHNGFGAGRLPNGAMPGTGPGRASVRSRLASSAFDGIHNLMNRSRMKTSLILLATLAIAGFTVVASPLPTQQIAADAKWVVHLDVEQFLKGKIGTHLMDNIVEKGTAAAKVQLKNELGFDLDWTRIQALTAYGSGYQPDRDTTGVILVRTGLDLRSALDAAITKEIPGFRVQKTGDATRALYSLNEDAFASFETPGLVLISKYKEAINRANSVLQGSSPNLAGAAALGGYPEAPAGFFLIAVADGFSQYPDLPPTAAILKQAIGARVVLGEAGDRLRLDLNVKTATADAARQIQQVTQGLLALATLNASQNPDLKAFTEAASISAAGPVVTLGAQIPVTAVIERMSP
jgi:hypothetical protein